MGRRLILVALLALAGCVEDRVRFPAPTVQTETGQHPATCYVRARNFVGFVPVSCAEAVLIRP